MNIKRNLCIVTLLVVMLITACEVIESTEIVTTEAPQEQEETALPDVAQDEIEDQEEDPLLGNDEQPMESQTPTTTAKSLELKEVRSFSEREINDFAWSPDGNKIALSSFEGSVILIDIHTNEEILLGEGKSQDMRFGNLINFSPDGEMLAVSTRTEGIKFYDVESQEQSLTLEVSEDLIPYGIAFSPDNMQIATCWDDNWGGSISIKIWDMLTGKLLNEFERKDSIFNLAYNQDGSLLYGLGSEGIVYTWDIAKQTEEMILTGKSEMGTSFAFTPDGQLLAVGTSRHYEFHSETKLRLFDALSGEIVHELEGHQAFIRSLAFNPDGGMLASACENGTVRLWDTQTGEQLAFLNLPLGYSSAAFSPDGTLLATAGFGDVLRLWRVPEPSAGIEGASPNTTMAASIIQALDLGEEFRPGRWSLDGRFVYYTNQGPMDEPGPDQAFQTLLFLDAQSGEICTSVQEIVNLSYNPWSETKIPEGPLIDERALWMNDNRLLYLSPHGELLAITPCSDSAEDLSDALPESISAFHYGASHDNSQMLLKGETSTWLFTPTTGQSAKLTIPESALEEETHFAWSPWEAKLTSSRVESGEDGLKIIIENIDPITGASEIIAEFPVVNEGNGWGHSISAYVSWTAKDQLFLHYLDNGYEKEKLIDLGSQPVEITDVFTDLFGIEPPSIESGLSLFGEAGTIGEEDYYLTIGTGLSPDGKLYLYSTKTGLVETYSLDTPKLLIFPDGDLLFGETYDATLEDMPLQIIQVDTDRPSYYLEINGEIPGQFIHGKVIMVDDNQHLLVATDQDISLIGLENGEMLQTWVLENHDLYDDILLSSSPDGSAIIIYGIQIDENEAWWSGHDRAIYLLNLDD